MPTAAPAAGSGENWPARHHETARHALSPHAARRSPAPPVATLLGGESLDRAAGKLRVRDPGNPRFPKPPGRGVRGMRSAMLDDLTARLVDATVGPGKVVPP